FLQHGVDIAPAVKIPLAMLVAYEKIDPALLRLFPSLATDPNKIEYVPEDDGVGGIYGTALVCAADRGLVGSIPALLKLKGINVNPEDEGGYSALHYAVLDEENGLHIARLLLDAGAD